MPNDVQTHILGGAQCALTQKVSIMGPSVNINVMGLTADKRQNSVIGCMLVSWSQNDPNGPGLKISDPKGLI